MAMCKDCVHVEVCREYVTGLAAARGVDLDVTELEQVLDSDDCDYFRDRSRFVELPIKLGEKIFYFDTKGRIHESTVTQLIYGASGFLIGFLIGGYQIGKTVFLTREAAEQALKERDSNAGRNDI